MDSQDKFSGLTIMINNRKISEGIPSESSRDDRESAKFEINISAGEDEGASGGAGGGADEDAGGDGSIFKGITTVVSPVCKLPCPPSIKNMFDGQKYHRELITVVRNISSSPTCFKIGL